MHTTKFLEVGTQKNINNHVFKCVSKVTNNMLNQQAINKENMFIGLSKNTPKSTFDKQKD